MSQEEYKEEYINEFDETKELLDLLEDDELLDIDYLLDELKVQDSNKYMDTTLQIELPDKIACLPGVKTFIEQINGLPRLNFQGQRDAKERFEYGEVQALHELIITGVPWISGIAEKYGESRPDEFLDYFQEGVFGLVKAIKMWDPEQSPLAAYAGFWIRQKITRYISDLGSPLRFPVHLQEKRKKVLKEIKNIGTIPSDVKGSDLLSWLPPVSLNSDISWVFRESAKDQALRHNENPIPDDQFIFEDIPDPRDLEDDIVHRVYLEKVRNWFNNSDLKEREKFILASRYGFKDGKEKTLEEIGKQLGITRERVRQIEKRALKRLRHPKRAKIVKVKGKSEKLKKNRQFPDYSEKQKIKHKKPKSISCTKNKSKIRQFNYDERKSLRENEIQKLIQVALHDLFNRDIVSETDLESALRKIKISKIKRFWETIFYSTSVREVLTSKQETEIEAIVNGELQVTQRELGLMKRALIRIYRRIIK